MTRYTDSLPTLWETDLSSDGTWLFGKRERTITRLKVYSLLDSSKTMLKGKCAFSAIDKIGCFGLSRARFLQRTMPYHFRVNFFSTSDDVSSVQLKIEYQNMADGLLRGDRACLARLITLIESQRRKLSLIDRTAFSVGQLPTAKAAVRCKIVIISNEPRDLRHWVSRSCEKSPPT